MMFEQTAGAWLWRVVFIDDVAESRDTSRRVTNESSPGGMFKDPQGRGLPGVAIGFAIGGLVA